MSAGHGVAAGPPRVDRAGVVGSALVHAGLLLGMLVVAQGADEPPPLVYAVNLVAAPAPGPAPRRAAEAALPVQESEPEAPPEKAPPKAPDPQPVDPPRRVDPDRRNDPALPTRSQTEPLPGERPSSGTDALTFRQEGLRFPYPEYLGRIVTEIRRRWVAPAGSAARLRAEVGFIINRDGTVTDVEMIKRSGNRVFDANALGAVELAAKAGAFGPLPVGWNGESLPIAFSFTPEGQ
ncbi:MAG TPA: energy transducer TonB [Gemmatimonadales bacterium]|nr:energy transducer TonB [Gemmatimonadales bacterium]